MKVVIGANSLTGQLTGIGHYTRCLVEGLSCSEDIEELRLLCHGLLTEPVTPVPLCESILNNSQTNSYNKDPSLLGKLRPIASKSRLLVELYDIIISMTSRFSLKGYSPGDIFHSPDFQYAAFPGKTVVTIPDLSTMTYPEFHPASRVAYINRHIKRVVDHADHIVTISEFVRSEVIEKLRVPADKVTTIYPGIDPELKSVSAVNFHSVKACPKLEYKNYFIFVSTIEPRKNLKNLLKAYENYINHEGAAALPLVIVGLSGWNSTEIHAEITRLVKAGHVFYLGYLERKELRQVLAGARALLFPSLYEGFGLPVAEAMKSGTAVLTSINSAMSEFSVDAALLSNPLDPDDIFDKILRMHKDNNLVQMLETRGLELSRQFTWENCARQTIRLYRGLQNCQ